MVIRLQSGSVDGRISILHHQYRWHLLRDFWFSSSFKRYLRIRVSHDTLKLYLITKRKRLCSYMTAKAAVQAMHPVGDWISWFVSIYSQGATGSSASRGWWWQTFPLYRSIGPWSVLQKSMSFLLVNSPNERDRFWPSS